MSARLDNPTLLFGALPRDLPRDLRLGTLHVVEAAFSQGTCLDLIVCP